MKSFIFRNNTIELLFGNDVAYSGYEDISYLPEDAKEFIWFYQVPFKYDRQALAQEVNAYWGKFEFVCNNIPSAKNIIAFTMADLYGIEYVKNDFSVREAVMQFDLNLINKARTCNNIKVIDINEFLCHYASKEWIDWKYYFISQTTINPRLARDFRRWFKRKVEEIEAKRKKCLVLDLDNTLWGGVVGEDGIDGIKIGGDYPGKAFLYFQQALVELSKNGVILTICSKNNEQDVLDVWEKNPYVVLKKEHISAYRINWTDKATNIKEIAEELNIGLDSMVFVDDNPTERELIKQMLPMVEVPEFPSQPYELPVFVKELIDKYFSVYNLTNEDKQKTEQYKANAQRNNEKRKFNDFNEYLRSLEIEIEIIKANNFNIPRIAQMTQKTNQFNLTTKRYTDADIKDFATKGDVWCISVKDRFGDNGITGAIIITKQNTKADIDTLLLSCRILGKGIEDAFVKAILNILYKEGIKEVTAKYLKTLKNSQVKDFYDRIGFTVINESEDEKDYTIDLNKELTIKDLYTIKIQSDERKNN